MENPTFRSGFSEKLLNIPTKFPSTFHACSSISLNMFFILRKHRLDGQKMLEYELHLKKKNTVKFVHIHILRTSLNGSLNGSLIIST